ncbi:MAG: hypothetical protein J7M05_01700, partial [Anaerolineae bacterium]|nr:hypothetical protein [Anaerolineae bacterium]
MRRVWKLALVLALGALCLSPSAWGEGTKHSPPTILPAPVSWQSSSAPTLCYSGCGGIYAPVVNAAYEQELVELVNQERAARGLPPLKRVAALDEAARYHATDMGEDDYDYPFHDTFDRVGGTLTFVCAWQDRVLSYYTNTVSLAENLAAGFRTPRKALDAWMNSDGHRANILSTDYWEIGVGYYSGKGYYLNYWVQDFGKREGVYPLIINGEAATTDSQKVSLYIYGEWNEVRLRNDDGPWTEWQPFQQTITWTLPAQVGE